MAKIIKETKELRNKSAISENEESVNSSDGEGSILSETTSLNSFSTPIKPPISRKTNTTNCDDDDILQEINENSVFGSKSSKRVRIISSSSFSNESNFEPSQIRSRDTTLASETSFVTTSKQNSLNDKDMNKSLKTGNVSQNMHPNIILIPQNNPTSLNTNFVASNFVFPSNNFLQCLMQPNNLINAIKPVQLQTQPIYLGPNDASATSTKQQNSQPGLTLPPNFGGTILYQPTIHIHCNVFSSRSVSKKDTSFRPIVPKGQKD
jgi:hypothetical protein